MEGPGRGCRALWTATLLVLAASALYAVPAEAGRGGGMGGSSLQAQSYLPMQTRCNVTSECVKCAREDLQTDDVKAACSVNGYRRQITCSKVPAGRGAEGGESVRDAFVSHQTCNPRRGADGDDNALSLTYFEGIVFVVLAFSAPIVVIRRTRRF